MTYERGKGTGVWGWVISLEENAQGAAKEQEAGEKTGRGVRTIKGKAP